MKNSELLDQYYTKNSVSEECCKILKNLIPGLETKTFLEPSAGTGSFIDAARAVFGNVKVKAYDIDPKRKDIRKADFLATNFRGKNLVTIGNPPFGKRSSLAIKFFNTAAAKSDIVAFIVPVQFEKYGVQKQLDSRYKLIYSERLGKDSFLYNEKDCDIRCVFQVWTILETQHQDLRIKEAPKTAHKDFEMFLYNNTPQALKFFDKKKYGWDFAVPRQGFYDYSLRITDPTDLQKKVQYMFFKAADPDVLQQLLDMDFSLLSQNNTTTPGFGKADVIAAYEKAGEIK